jgi:hypothetical protein
MARAGHAARGPDEPFSKWPVHFAKGPLIMVTAKAKTPNERDGGAAKCSALIRASIEGEEAQFPMGLTKVLAGVTGAVIVVAGVAVVAVHGGGGGGSSEKPAASAHSSVSPRVVAPATGDNRAASSGAAAAGAQAGTSGTQSASPTDAPAAQASPAVPVPAAAGAGGAASVPSAQDVLSSITALMDQLKQSTNASGQPHPLTPEQVNAAINDQLAKLGIKP